MVLVSESLETFPPARNNQEAKTDNWPGRIPSVTDTKMIVAWNSLMISGLARAAGVFQEPLYLELAARAANFIFDHQFVDGRFHRLNYKVNQLSWRSLKIMPFLLRRFWIYKLVSLTRSNG